MASSYPGGLDELNAGVGDDTDPLDSPSHPDHHAALADAVEATQAELGLDPAGASATVRARLDTLDSTVGGKAAASHTHAESDVTGLVSDLAGKAATSHTHGQSDVTDLTTDLAGKVPVSLVDAKGDLIAATAADTVARLGVGTNGHVLTADSAEATGLKWAAASGSGDPTMGGDLSGVASNAQIVAGAVTDVEVASANKDGVAGTASMRTLGTGSAQAAAGNHNHSGVYSAVGHTHTSPDVTDLGDSATLDVGTGSGTVAAGDHNHSGVYQAADSDLTAVAGLSTNGLVERTGSGTAAVRTIGVAAGTDIPTTGDADTRYSAAAHNHDSTYVAKALVDAKGDIVTATAADTPARLAVGTDGHVLTADSTQSTGVKWAAASGGGIAETLIDAKGDLIAGSAADTAARLAVGTNGHVLTADSGEATGLKWAAASGGDTFVHGNVPTDGNYFVGPVNRGVRFAPISHSRISFMPMVFAADVTADRIGIRLYAVGTAGAGGANGRLGIYNNGAGNKPGTLLLDAGELDFTATTGWREITISQSLTAGTLYWLCLGHNLQGTTPQFLAWHDTSPGGWGGIALGQPPGTTYGNGAQYEYVGWVQTSWTYGALPSTAGTTTAVTGSGSEGIIFCALRVDI